MPPRGTTRPLKPPVPAPSTMGPFRGSAQGTRSLTSVGRKETPGMGRRKSIAVKFCGNLREGSGSFSTNPPPFHSSPHP